jgi:ubiquinone/menaquinone biosynthesis C-methylase UbiE
MVPPLFAPWAARLIERAAPRAGERVLDVGCGTGIVARLITPRVAPAGQVLGLDASADMLAVARSMSERQRLATQWREGSAEALPFPDHSFDLVTCQFALMFFEDRRAALFEMYRVLRANGRVALSVWQSFEQHPFYRRLDEAIERRTGLSGVRNIFSIEDAEELDRMMRHAGFARVQIESLTMTARFPDPPAFLAREIEVDTTLVPSMQLLDAQARGRITREIAADMQDALSTVIEGNEVVMPFQAYLVGAARPALPGQS